MWLVSLGGAVTKRLVIIVWYGLSYLSDILLLYDFMAPVTVEAKHRNHYSIKPNPLLWKPVTVESDLLWRKHISVEIMGCCENVKDLPKVTPTERSTKWKGSSNRRAHTPVGEWGFNTLRVREVPLISAWLKHCRASNEKSQVKLISLAICYTSLTSLRCIALCRDPGKNEYGRVEIWVDG